MGEANEGRRRISGMENLFEKYPRDLLQRFMAGSNKPREEQEDDDEEEVTEEIELNLGLSLGGRFGVDKNSNKLIRSASVASSIPLIREDEDATNPPPVFYPSLIRTSSLPTETEEEWRKRKELQTLRRMEAKRRRLVKQKSSNPLKTEKEGSGAGCTEEEKREIDGSIGLNLSEKQYIMAAAASNRFGASAVVPPFGLPSWAAAATRQALIGGGNNTTPKGKGSFLGGGGLQGFGQPNSQGSIESQGGSSSGISDLESKQVQGSSSGGEARSPASNQSLQERSNQETMGSSRTKASENTCRALGAVENPSKRPDLTESTGKETGMSAVENMPCVFTIGDGPNGRRIDGILYKYGKGEEVRIMCVCHGSFLSPAEFVKHAGGGDVAHPLRHIVINPSSNSLL